MEKSIKFYFQCLIQQSCGSKLASQQGDSGKSPCLSDGLSPIRGLPGRLSHQWRELRGQEEVKTNHTQRASVETTIRVRKNSHKSQGNAQLQNPPPTESINGELLLARKRNNNQQRMTSYQKRSCPFALRPLWVPISISENQKEARRYEYVNHTFFPLLVPQV